MKIVIELLQKKCTSALICKDKALVNGRMVPCIPEPPYQNFTKQMLYFAKLGVVENVWITTFIKVEFSEFYS